MSQAHSAPSVTREQVEARIREYDRLQPPLGVALRADALAFSAHRGEPTQFRSRWREWANVVRLLGRSGEFCGLSLYRLRVSLRKAHVPVLPTLINKLCVWFFGIRIGDHVLVEPGVYINHGNVIVDGVTRIGTGCVITAWVTIGLKAGNFMGPDVGPAVFFGPKASVIGQITIGRGAQIGPHAVVVSDVPAHAVVAAPRARRVGSKPGIFASD